MTSKYEFFSATVNCLSRDIQKIEKTEMAKFGLKRHHAQCLLAMKHYSEGITAAELCDLCEKDKAAISRTLSELERNGLIRRVERNGIRYRSRLMLTEEGLTAAEAVSRRAQQAVEQAGAGLEDEKRQIFYQVLALITRNLHSICQNGLKEE